MARARFVPRDGTAWMVALLALSLAVLIALAWQAFDAARGHREAAQDVLRDYARLAADELAARCLQAVGYYGAVPALQQLVLLSERSRDRNLVAPADLARIGDPQIRGALSLFATSIRFVPATGSLETAGAPIAAPVAAWLSGALGDAERVRRSADQAIAPLFAVLGGAEHRVFYVPVRDRSSPVYGLVLDARTFGDRLLEGLGTVPLLPPSLAGEDVGTEAVAVALDDAAGDRVLVTGRLPGSDPYGPSTVTHVFGSDYLGLLEGWTARVGLDPEAAPKLVIGGLPRSRLPMLAGLIALGAALLVAALVQLHRARRLSRLRADFIAEVSHELRTPLTQIRMFTETLLLGRVRSDAEGRRSLEIVDREARRLSRLVENILQFARRQRGAIVLARRQQLLAPIVRAVLDEMAPMADGADMRVEASLDEHAVAEVDAAAMKQMLINLLDNALKYGPNGQTVRVSLAVEGGACALAVEDQGPGVPKAERERVFDSYRRLDRDRRAAIAGTGIGLAVVRDLIGRHGGRARVTAGSDGGARFELTLPASAVPQPAAVDDLAVEGSP